VTPGPEPVQLGMRTDSVRPGGHACPAQRAPVATERGIG